MSAATKPTDQLCPCCSQPVRQPISITRVRPESIGSGAYLSELTVVCRHHFPAAHPLLPSRLKMEAINLIWTNIDFRRGVKPTAVRLPTTRTPFVRPPDAGRGTPLSHNPGAPDTDAATEGGD